MAKKHKKRCSTSLIRKPNQNYNEVSLHTGQNGHYQKLYKKREPFYTTGRNENWYSHYAEQYAAAAAAAKSLQSCPTLSDTIDCNLPGSSARGVFQVRVLEWGGRPV